MIKINIDTSQRSPLRASRLSSVWPWGLLAAWLAVAAAQLWSLQVEAVQRGTLCGTSSTQAFWKGPGQ